MGRGLSELVCVSTVLSLGKKCVQLRVHVAEDKGQLGQLSPVEMASEDMAGPWGALYVEHPQAPDSLTQQCRVKSMPTLPVAALILLLSEPVYSSVKESRCCPYPHPSVHRP